MTQTRPRYQALDNRVRYYHEQPVTITGRHRAGDIWMYDIRIELTGERIDSVPEAVLSDAAVAWRAEDGHQTDLSRIHHHHLSHEPHGSCPGTAPEYPSERVYTPISREG
jgi:hypothetical protein